MLRGKKILLGITASIAAYKAAHLVRLLIKSGAEVKVVMTPASMSFITPLTLSTLSKNPVHSEFTEDESENAVWTSHVDLGLWADYMIIAPATSNTLAKMVSGTCDNLLIATYMSSKCPVYVAPAMDLDMYKNEATQNNLKELQARDIVVLNVDDGELASGLFGPGRMAEPENIVAFVENHIKSSRPLFGKKVLINAGPTYERIDAVRFIGNFSTGKMGVALARQAVDLGAEVHLVLGPSQLPFDLSGMNVTRVESSNEMYDACTHAFKEADVTILSAAVADFKPKDVSHKKLKKNNQGLTVDLVPTKDILASLGEAKKENQLLVGFALETDNELQYAKDKLKRKNLDFIVLNSLNEKGAGFGHDTNKVTVLSKQGLQKESALLPKDQIAIEIWNILIFENA